MEPREPTYQWPPGTCEEVQVWLSARADGECSPAQEGWLSAHLSGCQACSREWAALEATRLALETARFREPTDFERDSLRRALAPRALQVLGWGLLVAGALVVLGFAAYEVAADDSAPLPVRLGMAAVGLGVLLLFARVLWGRLREYPYDPYRNVQR